MSYQSSEKSEFSYGNPPPKPSIVGRIQFVMQDPKFTTSDRIEYGAYWLATAGLIAFALLVFIWAIVQRSLETAQCVLQLIFIFGVLPLIAWRLLRKFSQRFSYAYHESIGGKSYAQKIAKQNEQIPALVQKTATSYVSFSLISGILTLLFVAFLIPIILLTLFLDIGSGIIIALLVTSSLVFIGALIVAFRLTWKPTDEYRKKIFPETPSFSGLWIFIIILIVCIALFILIALGFHLLAS
jgi:hypothetical protein